MTETIRLYSFFVSIQGESTRAGLPCAFVRLAGCPLACAFCDTVPARDAAGIETGIPEIVARVLAAGQRLVEVTGGEPLAQPGAIPLLAALADAGLEVMLETSGAFPIRGVDPRVRVVMDIKTPGSGMAESFCAKNLDALVRGHHEVKFVVTSRADFDWAVARVRGAGLADRCDLLVSPAHPLVAYAELAEWVLASGLPLRFQPQLHRLIWPAPQAEER
ncbi:MAG: 7-carboxy-7-deazaguanine synthase QueE [Proteobacteria bacterium]|jgi:7-carboxy-7-deazaguanine synthase|nr:7-carboxy-7-deazaguanine synthase QueE [Pseudomonadota bacterium]